MTWIVIGEQNGKLRLVSSRETTGMLPKGSYLTVDRGDSKFILRVDDSGQTEPYAPSPLVVDMDLSPLVQDQECRNVITAYRVKDLTFRSDGYIDFIPPQTEARRSNQEEIDMAVGSGSNGPRVFVAAIHSNQNQVLRDEGGRHITARLPVDMFYHQLLICGKTGSGKTVAMKYLAQYFAEELEGAVLAVNVKDVDFLRMNRPSKSANKGVLEEWSALGEAPRGVANCVVYQPATIPIDASQGLDMNIIKSITLDVKKINPDALTGLLQGISDVGAQSLPDIFRYWQEEVRSAKDQKDKTFSDFVRYFMSSEEGGRILRTKNTRGEISEVPVHKGTFDNIVRNLAFAKEFFDNRDAICLSADDILSPGKMSIINVAGSKGIQFGSVLLRDLLQKIVEVKDKLQSEVPVLIIIDEVHQFYNTESSLDALGVLDTICRTGRSKKIGVVFASQNPSDIPRGLASVINTKIFFKSDANAAKQIGMRITDEEMEGLKKGYAITSIHELSLLKVVKFPLSFAGVFETGG